MRSAWVIELSVYISNSQAKSRAIQGQKKQAFFGFFKWHDAHISCAGFNLKYLWTKKCDGSVPIYPIPPKILPWGSMAGVGNLLKFPQKHECLEAAVWTMLTQKNSSREKGRGGRKVLGLECDASLALWPVLLAVMAVRLTYTDNI